MNQKKLSEMTVLELLTFALVSTDPVETMHLPSGRARKGEIKIVTVLSPLARRIFQMCILLCQEMVHTNSQNPELTTRCRELCPLLTGLFWLVAIEENPILIYHPNRNLCKEWAVMSSDLAMFIQAPRLGAVSNLVKHLTEVVGGTYVPSILPVLKPVVGTEQVIGTIEEKWVRGVHLLANEVCCQIPALEQDEFPGPAEDCVLQHISYAIGILQQIFTTAIRDAIPDTRRLSTVTLREDWKVVVTEADVTGSPVLVVFGPPTG